MDDSRETLERRLNDFDPAARRAALEALAAQARAGRIAFPEPRPVVNMHGHTFFSFNGYGYSPSCFAWKARCEGLSAAGVVDFDVLDAVDEFLDACRLLGLRGSAGLETRIFVPEFETREINSPGEPGISYHMGAGFTTGRIEHALLTRLKETAQSRNRSILDRVNPFLAPIELDLARDVWPLTPNGNATERHLCMAYEQRAAAHFPDTAARAAFWAEKLGMTPDAVEAAMADSAGFQGLIRSKLMKQGGVGYVPAKGPDFPRMREVNTFTIEAGGIPVLTWLNGLTAGEQAIDELADLMQAEGAAALNIVPDRNWNIKDPDERRAKVAKLHEVVAMARTRGFPILVGTEMNAPGQKFVDDFDVPEMAPVAETFLEGAMILYAHTVLQAARDMGYLSPWAAARFASVHDKNAFFAAFGRRAAPEAAASLEGRIAPDMTPEAVLAAAG